MKKLIVANWKSNKSLTQAQHWLQEAQALLASTQIQSVMPVLAPPAPFLTAVRKPVKTLGWQLAIQDISPFPAGSYTGAVSGVNLSGLAVKYVLVGHSERRQYFHESVQEVAHKVEQILDIDLTPIVFVDQSTLVSQAAALSENLASQCIVVYEPPDAIGIDNNVPLSEVKIARQQVDKFFGKVPFLYGGSVNEQNIGEYLLVTDGVIVGTASLDVKQFMRVLSAARGMPPVAG